MSLTSFLKNSKDVRQRFKAEFTMPPFAVAREMVAPPLTENYSLVGTAFDYLLRFYVERLNPKAVTGRWVAEEILFGDGGAEDALFYPRKFKELVAKANQDYNKYLLDGVMSSKLLRSVICLAQMDVFYRRDVGDSYIAKVGKVSRKDFQDLRNLIALAQPEVFKANQACVLNPTFGRGSSLVGGADCDLVIDDTLIDIKTTKYFKLERGYFNQLVGYYTLFRIGGIKGLPKGHSIKRLGIYFARHGYLWVINVVDILNENQFSKFLAWFKKQAKEEFSFA
jgi:hypothetical protein